MKRIKVDSLAGSPISVWWNAEWQEYVVKVKGKPNASYHTSDRGDAMATAQKMRNDVELMSHLVNE